MLRSSDWGQIPYAKKAAWALGDQAENLNLFFWWQIGLWNKSFSESLRQQESEFAHNTHFKEALGFQTPEVCPGQTEKRQANNCLIVQNMEQKETRLDLHVMEVSSWKVG